ncbi:MAG: NUDIX domain-containing protein [bacterium]|nr:NUDIX domain-containing protein [bacterium]
MPEQFLRLGTSCLVFNDAGEVLLSQRGDLGTWNIPGGRLDKGELPAEAAAREVREETGIEVEIVRPVGLYYVTRWQRLNVLFRGKAVGGTLLGRTTETLDNRFFPVDSLPAGFSQHKRIQQALNESISLNVRETPVEEYRRLRLRFGLRYMENWLSGRPEPRYPRFEVRAVAIVRESEGERVLAMPSGDGWMLPAILCDGRAAPWQQLAISLQKLLPLELTLTWQGVWQDTSSGVLEFVFAAQTHLHPLKKVADWVSMDNEFIEQDRDYLAQNENFFFL